MKRPIYLVPFDFTEVSESATRLALELAHANDGTVYLLHIVSKNRDRITKRKEFDHFVRSLEYNDQLRIETKVLIGDIFEDTGKAGDILKASLIVMGTHGARGFQKLFGSHAVKMISSSSSPFLITQGKKEVDKIKTIVMPFSFMKETIQITTFAASVAKSFNAKIHLVGFHDKDQWLEHKTQSNQLVVRKHLTDAGIDHEIINLPIGGNYDSNLLEYCKKADADIIAAAYFKEGIIQNPNSFIQMMIENEYHIPVLTVNAEELSIINSNLSFMTV